MIDSLKRKYEAQILEAEATLMIYLENAAGIGEHPQMLEEMDNMVEKLANSSDKLQVLTEFLGCCWASWSCDWTHQYVLGSL